MKNPRLNTTIRKTAFRDVIDGESQFRDVTDGESQILAGKKVYKGSQRYEVQAALEVLRQNGIVKKITPGASNLINDLSVMLAYGCTTSSESIDFSLMTDQTDIEEIDNENIMPNYEFVQNKKIETIQSFKNIKDSFYTLDDRAPLKIQESLKGLRPDSIEQLNRAAVTDAASYFAASRKLNIKKGY